jgi:NADPH-dependent glutamate synthase beta subunit-like oxidoreductase
MNNRAPGPAAAALPPTTWTTGSTEVFKTGTWRSALPRHIQAPSPCHEACPVNGDIAEWIGLARAARYRGAFDVLMRHNPFPAIAGRVCHHPCETACNRAAFDEAVSICKLERFVGDRALARGWRIAPPKVQRPGRVAVLGAGPAGLSAAYQLRRRGWRVTVFEASEAAGGLLRHGIPSYRLARDVLDAEIARLLALGIELRCNEPISTPAQFDALRAAHDAVFVATGAARVKRLPGLERLDGLEGLEGLKGRDDATPRVMAGAAYLRAANAGAPPALGRAVVVIGGGSAAFDAARSARRAGHAVTLLALESRPQLPAQPEEVAEALEEGITLVDGAMLRQAGRVRGGLELDCQQVRFEPGVKRGTFAVAPIEGSEFRFGADVILTSIGQDPDLEPFGAGLARDGTLLAVDRDGATAARGVWAGGDVASLARTVTEALGMGRRAALAIHRHLLRDVAGVQAQAWPSVTPGAIATWYHGHAARAAARHLDAEQRLGGAEVQLGLDADAARAEAERCFSCGRCVVCDNCITVCPDLAVRRNGGAGYEVLADYCKGCGLCVRECPTGSMVMVQEQR